ncbi:ferric reductase NAD binding domain-containing protein [Limtongia smithiae]|uniref:ferric reductase NAD binding domain-containing protein n=1 Tax=Limtongia smithiae TaxID=1125753 RepID=UPI0034CF9FA8
MDVFREHLTDSIAKQWRDYIRIRAAIIAVVLVVPTFLFGGRNNILMYISGWSFETCNVFHRHIGFWMFWQSAVHGIVFTIDYTIRHRYMRIWTKLNLRSGAISTMIASVIVMLAAFPIRHYYYEFFLASHIILAIVFAKFVFYHAVDRGYPNYVYALVAIWAFDRVIRLVRICSHGLYLNAEVTANADIMTIKVKPRFDIKPKPGQYGYLYIADLHYKFWESHPFSVIESRDGKYHFLVGKEGGMTRWLHNRAINSEGGTTNIRVMVEGWYGHEPAIARYDTVLIIGGGIGITAAMATALDVVRKARINQHVFFYWILRGHANLEMVSEQLSELSASSHIDVTIFCRPNASAETESLDEKIITYNADESDSTNSISKKKSQSSASLEATSCPNIVETRPAFGQIIASTISDAPGSVAVFTCGPGTLVDECRRAVTENAGNGRGRVEYFEDAFSWA